MKGEVKLGDLAYDIITGFKGIVLAKVEWLTGCVQYCLKPMELHEGKPIYGEYFDGERVKVATEGHYYFLKEETQTANTSDPGGPQSDSPGKRSYE